MVRTNSRISHAAAPRQRAFAHVREPMRGPIKSAINEMERQLNRMAQEALGNVLNPYSGNYHVKKSVRQARQALATPKRLAQLQELIGTVRRFIAKADRARKIAEEAT